MTLLLKVALLLSFWTGQECKLTLCPPHSCSVTPCDEMLELLWCVKIWPAREGNTLILEAQAEERRDSREKRVSRNGSSGSQPAFLLALEGAGQGHWFAWWNDLWVKFWQAGFDFWGVLDTLRKAVYLDIPATSLLTLIPYWNKDKTLLWSMVNMHTCLYAPGTLLLLWKNH